MERSCVGSLLRSTQALCQQICEKQTFDFGIAFFSKRFPKFPEANQIREVVIDDAQSFAAAFQQATDWFSQRGLNCLRWTPAAGVAPEAMLEFLGPRGFQQRTISAMHLAEWPEMEHRADIRILPARALRGPFRMTFIDSPIPEDLPSRETLTDAFMERLDDPQLDMFVATAGGRPAGHCGLYQVGDIARVLDLRVLPPFADRWVAESLLAHVLALAKRLMMPQVLAQVDSSNRDRLRWMAGLGFVEDGQVVEFELPTSFALVPPA